MIDELFRTQLSRLAVLVCVTLALTAPGAAVLAVFAPGHLWQLEFPKLILVSLGIALPFFLANATVTYLWWMDTKGQQEAEAASEGGLLGGAVFSIPPIYAPLAAHLATGWPTIRGAIGLAVAIEGAILAPMVVRIALQAWKHGLIVSVRRSARA